MSDVVHATDIDILCSKRGGRRFGD